MIKTKLIKKTTFFCGFIFIVGLSTTQLSAQDPEGFEYKAFQSPEAYSLGKFGEIPVSLYTGIPNISVPITQISAGSFSLPISLDYHASGIKAEEKASWVGLGWALSAGGMITRSPRGDADDHESYRGYIFDGGDILDNHPIMDRSSDLVGSTSDSDELAIYSLVNDDLNQYMTNFIIDTEPDVFFFNFAGRSGQFVLPTNTLSNGTINSQAEIRTIPHSNLKITLLEMDTLGIKSWSITDEQGVQFIFKADEIHKYIINTKQVVNEVGTGIDDSAFQSLHHRISWYLTKIELPGTSEEIHLDYSNQEEVRYYSRNPAIRFGLGADTRTDIFNSVSYHMVRKLKSIESNSHILHFETASTPDRLDAPKQVAAAGGLVPDYTDYRDTAEFSDNISLTKQEYELHSIKLYKKTGSSDSVEIKRWNFNTGYFNNSASKDIGHTDIVAEPDLFKRLKLNSVDVADANDNVLQTYAFEYNEPTFQYGYYDPISDQMKYPSGVDVTLPPYLDQVKSGNPYFYYLAAFDHWGYFNGVFDNNVFNIPDYNSPVIDYTETTKYYPGPNSVDRQPNEAAMKAGILKKITYPTGGHTDFEYEINKYDAVGWKQHSKQNAGGLRIKKIESYGDLNAEPVIKTYSYTEDYIGGGNQSSGVLVSEPVYLDQYFEGDFGSGGGLEGNHSTYGYSSSSLIPLGSTLGGIVGYKEVSIGFGANNEYGYEVSKFSSPESQENSDTLNTAIFISESNHQFQYQGQTVTVWEFDKLFRQDHFTTYDTQDLYTDHFSRMKWGFGYRSVMDSRRGKLLSKEIYNSNKQLLQKTTRGYQNTMDHETEGSDSHVRIKGLSVSNLKYYNHSNLYGPASFSPTYAIIYEHISSSNYLVADTTYTYQPGQLSNPMMTINRYEYDNNYLQSTEKVERNSNNDERVTQYKYAYEEYSGMKTKNMLTQPYSVTIEDGSGQIQSKTWTLWKDWGGGQWLPCGKWVWDGGSLTPSLTCNSN